MDWMAILRAFVAALIPAAYAAIKARYPDFPLELTGFGALIEWLIFSFLLGVSGWNLKKASVSVGGFFKRQK